MFFKRYYNLQYIWGSRSNKHRRQMSKFDHNFGLNKKRNGVSKNKIKIKNKKRSGSAGVRMISLKLLTVLHIQSNINRKTKRKK